MLANVTIMALAVTLNCGLGVGVRGCECVGKTVFACALMGNTSLFLCVTLLSLTNRYLSSRPEVSEVIALCHHLLIGKWSYLNAIQTIPLSIRCKVMLINIIRKVLFSFHHL